eukprot:CAMPEP_0170191194 /NCGR_PEP_ID=MMETSP0040_2-20121228/51103_1 /TAXON_ID=641309 /ORGANISM="Lotharella oceanica, Strain CCMP622" /LENGTH=51 /DNA_ID=CAMNT_0010439219 /DNA_START=23 /DNA_END=175 /DNA_ORIENTATION=-
MRLSARHRNLQVFRKENLTEWGLAGFWKKQNKSAEKRYESLLRKLVGDELG